VSPAKPSPPPAGSWSSLAAIVVRLRTLTDARIAVLSLPVLGQDLDAPATAAAGQYSGIVESVAQEHGAAYLPLYETQLAHLRVTKAPSIPYREPRHPVFNATLVQRFLLRRSLDEISRRRRLALTTDGIHQNSHGASMIAELIGEFLSARQGGRS
jgi:lysophospholipase L1-like esterase